MPGKVKAFWLEPQDLVRVELRRFTFSERHACPAIDTGCDASAVILDEAPLLDWLEKTEEGHLHSIADRPPENDPRWPSMCEACGDPFPADADYQVNARQLYRAMQGPHEGQLFTLRNAPPGALWDAHWMTGHWKGSDGMCLVAKLPNGLDWMIDGQASNCTSPDTWATGHRCWVRHGDPRTGDVHVDKNGATCAAGAGSIAAGEGARHYHGFLHHGWFT